MGKYPTDIYCECYHNDNKPPLLTDWKKTNVCQNCGKRRKHMNFPKKSMKRYLLFRWSPYSSCGGWSDFHGDFKTLAEAYGDIATGKAEEKINGTDTFCGLDFSDCNQIVDTLTMRVVYDL